MRFAWWRRKRHGDDGGNDCRRNRATENERSAESGQRLPPSRDARNAETDDTLCVAAHLDSRGPLAAGRTSDVRTALLVSATPFLYVTSVTSVSSVG
jgi:hypothetical protein